MYVLKIPTYVHDSMKKPKNEFISKITSHTHVTRFLFYFLEFFYDVALNAHLFSLLGPDYACSSQNGLCQVDSDPCTGDSYHTGLCGGAANRRCCINKYMSVESFYRKLSYLTD